MKCVGRLKPTRHTPLKGDWSADVSWAENVEKNANRFGVVCVCVGGGGGGGGRGTGDCVCVWRGGEIGVCVGGGDGCNFYSCQSVIEGFTVDGQPHRMFTVVW